MRSALVRQCLQLLREEEIEELLASSWWLREGVREEAHKPKNARIDARLFRRWMSRPSDSDLLLQKLPDLYASEYQTRLEHGDPIPRTVGVRALLALHEADQLTVESFRDLVAGFRDNPEPEPIPDGLTEAKPPMREQPGREGPSTGVVELDMTVGVDSTTVDELIAELQSQSQSTANALRDAAHAVTSGLPAPTTIPDLLSSWSSKLAQSWSMLGASEMPPANAFEVFAALRDRLIERESAEKQAEEAEHQRQEKLAKLEALRQTVVGLEKLAATDETFRETHQRVVSQITELERELGSGIQHADDEQASIPPTDDDSAAVHGGGDPSGVRADDDDSAAPETSPAQPGDVVTDTTSRSDDDGAPLATTDLLLPEQSDARQDIETASVGADPVDAETDVTTCADSSTAIPDATNNKKPDPHTDGWDSEASPTDCAGPLVDLVHAGRFGAAWLVATAAGLPALDATAYRLAACAFHSGPGALDPSEVLIGLTTILDGDRFASSQSAKVALAATLRATLAAGWTPRSELDAIVRQINLDERWRTLVDAAIAAADRNYQHLQDFGRRFEPSLEEVHENARTLKAQLHQQRINFSDANRVLRYLLRSQEPLGAALDAVLAPTTGEQRREALTSALAALESPDSVIEAADREANTHQQRRRGPIVAHARTSLGKAIESVVACVSRALGATVVVAGDTRVAVAQESRQNLAAAAKAISILDELCGPGDAAMARLLNWIIAPDPPGGVTSETQLLINESLPLTTVDRAADGLPIIEGADAAQVIDALNHLPTSQEIYDAYVSRGDLQQAAAVASQQPDVADHIEDERSRWQRKLRNEVAAVRAEVGRTYADDFTQEPRVDAEARLVEPAEYCGDRFDLQMAALQQLRDHLAAHRAQTANELRAQATHQVSTPRDRDSIIDLIDKEDFVGANELLALARVGPLPPREDTDDAGGARVFHAFIRDLSFLSVGAKAPIGDVVAAFSARAGGDLTLGHGDLDRLNNWDQLMSPRAHGRQRQSIMASILRAIGLDVRGEVTKQSRSTRHFDMYKATATPVDKSLVPGLGSQASHYMVAATADSALLLQKLSAFPINNGPNIVLFDGVLTIDQRRQCLTACREQRISAIIVDRAVAAWVALHHPRSFRAVQQITLPFTCFSHYTVVAGNVPDEVFVGRADELNQLTSQTGSLFVYGGRQLGKSALLRKIQRDFNTVPDHHAIFIDLNAHGIGTWSESRKLWNVLYNELAAIGDFGLKPSGTVTNHEPVIKAIQNWLGGNESRRLLLLLDETDAFLEKESSEAPNGFKNIGPLKGLFDNTGGRFKPVFAGLHKVQRLQNVANTPLAHGGRDVLIGPLAARPARDLVVKPLEALGYRFENPDAVWRLLAFTNLQPGLIQVVCNDLIDHLRSRPLRNGEPLIIITDDDIDQVTQNEVTVNKIAEKLRLTIELEDRYRVIALAVAIMCMDDSFRERYSADDIREHCEYYWQQGFEDLNSAEFAVYLDELIGLGVLSKDHDDRFSVRSPNIVTMLGTREQLVTVLEEEDFQLEPAYNPKSTRRQVIIGGIPTRSPLSEQDLSKLIPVTSRHQPRNFVVVGSEALGIADVAPVLESVGAERNTEVTILDAAGEISAETLADFKFASGGVHPPRLLVVDACRIQSERAAAVAAMVQSLRKRGQGHLVVVFGADGIDAADRLFENRNVVETHRISLQKWSGDGIRSWHDNPFTTPEARSQLLSHSGGWPQLVERAVDEVANRGISNAEECRRLSSFPADVETANEFLRRVGVDDHIRSNLSEWAAFGSTDYEPVTDIAEVLGREVAEMRSIATKLTLLGIVNARNDEYMIDPVVIRALNALA